VLSCVVLKRSLEIGTTEEMLPSYLDEHQGRSQKFVLGRYKTLILMFNYRFDVILSHKTFTWIDFGRIYTLYTPRHYAPDEHMWKERHG